MKISGNIYSLQFEDITQEEMDFLSQNNEKLPLWAMGITNKQGKEIAKILVEAKKHKFNIVVHCTAGVSRSGAVTEAALILGYKVHKTSNLRTINPTVFHLIKNICL